MTLGCQSSAGMRPLNFTVRERSMSRLYLTSVTVGIVVVWLTQWAWLKGTGYIYNGSSQSLIWYGALNNVLLGLALVVPGFCTAWIAKRHGILLGALSGLIGGITYTTLVSPVLEHHSNLIHYFASWPWIIAFSS